MSLSQSTASLFQPLLAHEPLDRVSSAKRSAVERALAIVEAAEGACDAAEDVARLLAAEFVCRYSECAALAEAATEAAVELHSEKELRSEKEREVRALSTEMSVVEAQLAVVQADAELEEQITALIEQDMLHLKHEMAELEKQLRGEKVERGVMKAQMKVMESMMEADELVLDLADLREERLKTSNRELVLRMESAARAHADAVSALDREVKNLRATVDDAKSKLQRLEEAASEAEAAHRAAEALLSSEEQANKSLIARMRELEGEALKMREQVVSLSDRHDIEVAALKSEVARLVGVVTVTQKELDEERRRTMSRTDESTEPVKTDKKTVRSTDGSRGTVYSANGAQVVPVCHRVDTTSVTRSSNAVSCSRSKNGDQVTRPVAPASRCGKLKKVTATAVTSEMPRWR